MSNPQVDLEKQDETVTEVLIIQTLPKRKAVQKAQDKPVIEEMAKPEAVNMDTAEKKDKKGKKDKKNKAAENVSLCKLVKKGYMDKHLKEYQQLLADPQFICLKCGRVAHDKKSLCRPLKMG